MLSLGGPKLKKNSTRSNVRCISFYLIDIDPVNGLIAFQSHGLFKFKVQTGEQVIKLEIAQSIK